MFGLDLSFFDLEMLRKFVWNGLVFSVQLTIIATIGGVIFGTLLALMRLSGSKILSVPATF
jgi:glutamate/aspartate transport system permease protein